MFQIEHDYFEHSEILGWRMKYGKIIFNRLFQKKSVFQITSSILLKVVPQPFPGQKMSRIDFLTVATNFRFLFDFYGHSLLKRSKLSTRRMSSGRLFHKLGAADEKARSPIKSFSVLNWDTLIRDFNIRPLAERKLSRRCSLIAIKSKFDRKPM